MKIPFTKSADGNLFANLATYQVAAKRNHERDTLHVTVFYFVGKGGYFLVIKDGKFEASSADEASEKAIQAIVQHQLTTDPQWVEAARLELSSATGNVTSARETLKTWDDYVAEGGRSK